MNHSSQETSSVAILALGGAGAAVLDNLAVACEGEHRTLCICAWTQFGETLKEAGIGSGSIRDDALWI